MLENSFSVRVTLQVSTSMPQKPAEWFNHEIELAFANIRYEGTHINDANGENVVCFGTFHREVCVPVCLVACVWYGMESAGKSLVSKSVAVTQVCVANVEPLMCEACTLGACEAIVVVKGDHGLLRLTVPLELSRWQMAVRLITWCMLLQSPQKASQLTLLKTKQNVLSRIFAVGLFLHQP